MSKDIRSPQIGEDSIFLKVKEMFPDAPDFFIKAMYHNIKGKEFMWRESNMNEDSIPDSK
tara:strand:- start:3281 stop:3460 length:180 start_codon:yes stop_codon:yes gene_type:complete